MLNISKNGTINESGHPFLFGAFMPKFNFASLPRTQKAQKIPQPFTAELPDGSVAVGAAGDFVLLNADGSVEGVQAAADFALVWDLASESVA